MKSKRLYLLVALLLVTGLLLTAVACGGQTTVTETVTATKTATGTAAAVTQTVTKTAEPVAGIPAGQKSKIKVAVPFAAPHPLWICWYIAMDRGYFAEEGLDVEMIYVESTPMTVQFLLAGQVDFAWPSPAATINAYAAGHDVVSYFSTAYKFAFEIVVPADSPITAWEADQIRGKTIGISNFAGGEMPMVKGAIANLGLTEGKDVFLKESGEGGPLTFSMLQDGDIDIYSSSRADTGNLRIAGMELRDITPPGVHDFPFNSFVTTRKFFNANPATCIAHARAAAKAVYWYVENPRGAVDVLRKYCPDEVNGVEEGILQFVNVFYVEPARPLLGADFGYTPYQPWNDYQQYLLNAGDPDPEDPITFTTPQDVTKIIDNSLIKDINYFDLDPIKADAKAYKITKEW